MAVSIKRILNSPLMVGACMTAIVTVAGTMYAVFHSRSTDAIADADPSLQAAAQDCKTIVFDPNPPLNVRTEPLEKAGNIVGKLPNGEVLTVVSKGDGWLKVSAPISGWVYEKLTKQRCNSTPVAVLTQRPSRPDARFEEHKDEGSRLYEEALFRFQSGNLPGAIELARAVPAESVAYDDAQAALKTMPKVWNQARSKYETARQAGKGSRWNEVLTIAKDFPDIRFWREQLAPIVRQAIERKYSNATNDVQ